MHEHCQQLKRDGKIIASLNTGGILHDGHMSLVKIAKENADVVVLMIDFPIEFLLTLVIWIFLLNHFFQLLLLSNIYNLLHQLKLI